MSPASFKPSTPESTGSPRVCVFCASSRSCPVVYHQQAQVVGEQLAQHGYTIVYGGGAVGSMGALAGGALEAGGRVVGVLPHFMNELEWGHPGISHLELVADMRVRKEQMLKESAAVIALPGGSGTLDELLETVTLKRLGLYVQPIVLVNTRGYFDHWVQLMEHCINEQFMAPRHRDMWTVVADARDVVPAIRDAPPWDQDARRFAAV